MAATETGARTHFKIGSRKSKLAMVQSEYIMDCMKKAYPSFTYEIVNFDTKGDRILNVALPKIGDKGLFTKELEDALENSSIDFVVHSLKDMPCQTLPDSLIIAGVPEREDPSDALVLAKRWQETKKTLDDLEPDSVIGTSSLRRISQLKQNYPKLKFETIRGNLQTRFAKLDDEVEKKFDAIILAAAGLKRMGYQDRISQILPYDICMHAVSQGALGIECRRDDLEVIAMLNTLNHEDTVLKCVAERTFLAKLEGGCSAPIGVTSKVTDTSILLEGAVLDLEGTQRIQDKFEMKFESSSAGSNCPILSILNETGDTAAANSTAHSDSTEPKPMLKHALEDFDDSKRKRQRVDSEKQPKQAAVRHFSFIADLKIDEAKLIKAELCGLHLAEKLKEKGADVLIRDIKIQVLKS